MINNLSGGAKFYKSFKRVEGVVRFTKSKIHAYSNLLWFDCFITSNIRNLYLFSRKMRIQIFTNSTPQSRRFRSELIYNIFNNNINFIDLKINL